MTITDALLGTATGVLGGALGGVLTAGAIARNAAHAQTRLDAEERIRRHIRRYRATLAWDAAQLANNNAYSTDYANIGGQEDVAVAIVQEIRDVRPGVARRLERHLPTLFGSRTLALARQRALIDPARIDPTSEGQRHVLMAFRIDKQDPQYQDGLLPMLLHDQNDATEQAVYRQKAIAKLDLIEDAVTPRPLRNQSARDRASIDEATMRGLGTE